MGGGGGAEVKGVRGSGGEEADEAGDPVEESEMILFGTVNASNRSLPFFEDGSKRWMMSCSASQLEARSRWGLSGSNNSPPSMFQCSYKSWSTGSIPEEGRERE